MRVRLAFLDVALDVFNHHDRIVHHQSCCQRNAEHGQGIDGKSQQLHESKSPDERDWNGDCWNNRGAPILQEDEDDQNDQDDGLNQRAQHVFDRFTDYVGSIECHFCFHPGRETLGKTLQFGNGAAVYLKRIGVGELSDSYSYCIVSVILKVGTVIFGAEFGVSNVF